MADRACFKLVNPPGTGPIIRNDQGAGAGAARDLMLFKKATAEMFSVDANGLPDPGGGDPKREIIVNYGDIVADSDALSPFLLEVQKAITITAIHYAVNTSTATGVTNGQTITVKESAAGASVASVATPTANPGVAAVTWTSMGSITHAGIGAGEYLYLTFAKVSSGLVMAGLTFKIEYTLAA